MRIFKKTKEQKKSDEYRHEVAEMMKDINSLAILNYIHILVSDVYRESKGGASA